MRKSLLFKIAKRFGISLGMSTHPRKIGRMAVRDRYEDIKTMLNSESPIIVDGGGNNGSTTDYFLRQYKEPIIHIFEPIPGLVEQLNNKYKNNKNVNVHGAALGARTEIINFNIVDNLVSSSVLKPSELNQNIHGKNMDIVQEVRVPQVRLDDSMKGVREIDLLKLDLQGFELEALKGCGNLLDHVKIISTEVEFVPLYDNQPLFGDIDTYIRSKGFRLFNLYDLYTQSDGQLTAGDAVYLNSRYFE